MLRRLELGFLGILFTGAGISLGLIFGILVMVNAAMAEAITSDMAETVTSDMAETVLTDDTVVTDTDTATFDGLSPGNRKIAGALFRAQQTGAGTLDETTDGSSIWTADRIAEAKAGGMGWGQIFQEMKAEGLIAEKNLGQVISRQGHMRDMPGDDPSIIKSSDGGTTPGEKMGQDMGQETTEEMTAEPPETAATETVPGTMDGGPGETGESGETADTETFDQLSTGNRKIAKALFESQPPGDGATESGQGWTLERIAEAKADGMGWGQIFQEMKAEGLIAEKNLGQVVSGIGQKGATDTVVASAAGTGGGAGTFRRSGARDRSQIIITSGHGQRVAVNLVRRNPGGGNAFGTSKSVHVNNGLGGGLGGNVGGGGAKGVGISHGGGLSAGGAVISSAAGGSGISHGIGQGIGKGRGKGRF